MLFGMVILCSESYNFCVLRLSGSDLGWGVVIMVLLVIGICVVMFV